MWVKSDRILVKKDKIGSETEVSHALDMTDQNMSVRHQVQQNVFSKYSRIQFSKTFYIARETVSFFILRSFFLFVAKIGHFLSVWSDGFTAPCVSEDTLE